MRRLSIAAAQAFDRLAQEQLGLPAVVLMENAGRSVAEEALSWLKREGHVTIFCGTGNNGGDGLVAARHLLNAGIKVAIYLIGDAAKLKTDPLLNHNILINMGQKIVQIKTTAGLKAVKKSALIIDAIFGIGLSSPVQGLQAEVINFINRTKLPVLSVDVPSGLDADTGQVLGVAVKATSTITFIAEKSGFSKVSARKICGRITIKDIGIGYNQIKRCR